MGMAKKILVLYRHNGHKTFDCTRDDIGCDSDNRLDNWQWWRKELLLMISRSKYGHYWSTMFEQITQVGINNIGCKITSWVSHAVISFYMFLVKWFSAYWSFTSWQHLRSFNDGYRLVTVCTQCDFIVLPHCEPRPPQPWSHSVTLCWHWANQSLPHYNNAECLARKQQVSIFKPLVWLDQGSNPGGLNLPISQNRRWTLNSFGHPIWCYG